MLPSPELLKCLTFAFPSFHLRIEKGTFASEYQATHKVQKLSVYTVQILTMINNKTPPLLTRGLHYTFTLTTHQNMKFSSDYK